jgi:cytochrome bd-type quinol oxidase subunit 2
MGVDLPLLWVVIIGFGLMMYVVMDGFDLGVGILFPFVSGREDRDTMVNTVAPVWDGNETWLVLGGAALLAAFPLAYSVILSALYLPLVLMLCGLIWRGVAFEFRFKADEAHKPFWDKAFAGGSYVATFSQGVSLGAFIDGIATRDGAYAGGALDWLTPFSVFTGFGLLVAYALLGDAWLIMKTEGPLQERMITLARPIVLALLTTIGVVSLWTPLAHPSVAERWFTLPNFFRTGADPGAGDDLAVAEDAEGSRARRALRSVAGAALSRLQRARDQPMAQHRAAGHLVPRRGRAAAEHGLRARRGPVHHPDHPRLHRLVLLRVPGQGEARRGLPLRTLASGPRRSWLRRVGWLVAIWASSVAALALVAGALRLAMRAAGLTL